MDKPTIAQKAPFAVQVEAGKTYHWCACGRSKAQPFCDGSHQGTSFKPLEFTARKTETVYLCGCKQTKTPPFCDGTHKSL
ncbi:MAG: CDGSH iron-sulfur domain-containing protein [Spirochaetaceae bacterium]|nr:CDGSH iron-sulfur domain-containing protein [Spirochaetaceae bacterium]